MKYLEFYNKFYIKQLTEGLISTADIKKAEVILSRVFHKLEFNYVIAKIIETSTLFIKFKNKIISQNDYMNILSTINTCGYFISEYNFYDKNDNEIDKLIHSNNITEDFIYGLFNKMNNSEFTMIIIESKFNSVIQVPKYIYHLTLSKNYDKIMKKGLIPKTNNRRTMHLDRIYFGLDRINTLGLASQFGSGEYFLLEIDTDKLINKNDIKPTFYDDPDFSNNGIYTYSNIPPRAITKIDEIKV